MILFQDQWVLPFLFWLILLLLREVYLLFVLVARFTFWGQECLGSLSTVMQGGPTNCIWRRGKCNHIHHETFSSQHRKPSCSPFALQEARKSVYSLLVIQILYAFSGWWNENNVNVDLQTASPFTHWSIYSLHDAPKCCVCILAEPCDCIDLELLNCY